MNKILVSRSNIISSYDDVLIEGMKITFLNSGVYSLEYEDISLIELEICVDNGAKVVLYESCFLDDI